MCRKLVYLMSFVFVLALAGNASALNWLQEDADYDPSAPPTDYLWTVAANWDEGRVPDFNDSVLIGWQSPVDVNMYCLIDDTVTAVCDYMYVGRYGGRASSSRPYDRTTDVEMTGGTLTSLGDIRFSWYTEELSTFTMSGGTIDVGGSFTVGGGEGDTNLLSGTINIGNGGELMLRTPYGLVNIEGGTIVLDTNDPNVNHAATIDGFVFDGLLVAYNGRGIVDIDVDVNDTDPCDIWKTTTVTGVSVPGTAYDPNPAPRATGVLIGSVVKWTAGDGATSHDVYCDPNYDNVLARATTKYSPTGPNEFDPPGNLLIDTTYYWVVDTTDTGATEWPGHVWYFTTEDGKAYNPSPTDGNSVNANPTISWTPGVGAATHEVYLSTDWDDVNDRDANYMTPTGANSLAAGQLEFSATYYWAVDENNNDSTNSPGDIWSFVVDANYCLDDFESYAITTDLQNVWIQTGDGLVYLAAVSHGGVQSMKIDYYNTSFSYSSAARTTNLPSDFTFSGSAAYMSLWFAGHAGNDADKLYVKLEDGINPPAIQEYSDVNAITDPNWQEWKIILADFSGVDLENITKLTIGIGDEAGSPTNNGGIVYFDDIVFYPRTCYRFPFTYGQPEADLNDDCVVDWLDLEIMAADWLNRDGIIEICACDPCDPNLQGWWKLDEPFNIKQPDLGYKVPTVAVDNSRHGRDGYIKTARLTPGKVEQIPLWDPLPFPDGSIHIGGALHCPTALLGTRINCGSGTGSVRTAGTTVPFEYVDPNWADFTTDMTVMCWIWTGNPRGTPMGSYPNLASIVTKGGNANGWGLTRAWRTDEIAFYVDVPGCPWYGLTSNPMMPIVDGVSTPTGPTAYDGAWHHVAGTFETIDANNSRICVYLDGMLDVSMDVWGQPITINDYDVLIGNDQDTIINYGSPSATAWVGAIDDVRIYNRALLACEIMGAVKEVESGPLMNHDFETVAGGSVAIDASGNNHNGTLMNGASVVYDSGGNGKAASNVLDVNSNDEQYVNCGSSSGSGDPNWGDLRYELTLTAWVKVAEPNTDDWRNLSSIISKGRENAWGLHRARTRDTCSFTLNGWQFAPNTLPWYGLEGTEKVDVWDGRWHHVAGVYNGGTKMFLYIDGVEDGAFDINPNNDGINLSDYDVIIGGDPAAIAAASGDFYWHGRLDDVRIYDYMLSNAEIIQIMVEDETYLPLPSRANLYDKEPTYQKIVNFKDYSVLADGWLDNRMWPFE